MHVAVTCVMMLHLKVELTIAVGAVLSTGELESTVDSLRSQFLLFLAFAEVRFDELECFFVDLFVLVVLKSFELVNGSNLLEHDAEVCEPIDGFGDAEQRLETGQHHTTLRASLASSSSQ